MSNRLSNEGGDSAVVVSSKSTTTAVPIAQKKSRSFTSIFSRKGSNRNRNTNGSSNRSIPNNSNRSIQGSHRSIGNRGNTSKNNLQNQEINMDTPLLEWLSTSNGKRFGIKSFPYHKFLESNYTKLNLNRSQLTQDDIKLLVSSLLIDETEISSFNVGDNALTDDSVTIFMSSPQISNVTHLDLSHNDINEKGCQAFSTDLNLLHLDLRNNTIGSDGCMTLFALLPKNLIKLDLRRNGIDDTACPSMQQTFEQNTVLQKLDLRGNAITDDGCKLLEQGLLQNKTLSKLDLERNKCSTKNTDLYMKRNAIMDQHEEGITQQGIYFYINKDALAWQTIPDNTEEMTYIQEATNTIDGLALTIFHKALQQHKDNLDDVKKVLTRTLMPMSDRNVLHAAAEALNPQTLILCQYLVNQCNVNFDSILDDQGRSARSIAMLSPDKAKVNWAKNYGYFLNRYVITNSDDSTAEGRGLESDPVYKTELCTVHFATDILSGELYGRNVAIKMMKDTNAFHREQMVRLNSTEKLQSGQDIPKQYHRYDGQYVVALYRYHDVPDQDCQCLVFDKGGKNLHQIIDSEHIAGHNPTKIIGFGKTFAQAIQHVHSRGYIHADIKPRNVIRSLQGDVVKLIDLDNSQKIGQTNFLKDYSTAYTPPEMAPMLFSSSSVSTTEDVQKTIRENQSLLKKLNLSKSEDIVTYHQVHEKIQSLLVRQAETKSEQKQKASESIDVWAFGVCMYYLITSQPLFVFDLNDNLATVSEQCRLTTWQGLTTVELESVIPKKYLSTKFRENAMSFLITCLHKDPLQRFQNMTEVLSHEFFSI